MVDFRKLLRSKNAFPVSKQPTKIAMFEKLLEVLAALIAALNANTAALGGKAAAPAEGKTAGKAAAGKTEKQAAPVYPTLEEIVAAAQPILDAGQGEKIHAIATKYKVKKIRELAGMAEAVTCIEDLKALAAQIAKDADSSV